MRRVLLFAWLTFTLPCFAMPAHYIVVREDGDGTLSVTFRTQVEIAGTPELAPTKAWEGDGNRLERRLSASVIQGGKAQFETDVAASRWLRGEFDAVDGMPAQAAHLAQNEYFYVLRIPALDKGGRLQLGRPAAAMAGNGQGGTAGGNAKSRVLLEIDLDEVVKSPVGAKASASDVVALIQNGDPANRLDLLILAEGYTADQRAKFEQDARSVANSFLGISPYSDYRNLVNVSGLFLVSQQAGADKPACAETPGQPVVNVNTALGATFCTSGIRRLVTANTATALAEAAVAPNWDKLIVLVNDAEYGGSGGSVSVATLHTLAAQLVQHEFAHSFTLLADEYTSAYPGFPACNDAPGSTSPCEVNVTDRTSPLKWSGWVTAGTPIPTVTALSDPKGAGAWLGARYLASGMYRQCYSGIMLTLSSAYFCHVDGEAYVKRLYASGWGVPSGGISNIDPANVSPAGSTVGAATGSGVAFRANVAGPGTSLAAVWKVDGATVKTESLAHGALASYDYAVLAGSHAITLSVTDASSFLLTPRTSTRTWQVTGSGAPSPTIRLSNISTRGRVLTGNDVMIGGFVIGGSASKTVLARARGPSMIPAGVTDALADPQITLVNQATGVVIGTNDNWGTASNASAITATGKAPTNALESAILMPLGPGAYTAVVSGVNNGVGVGIVEVFEIDAPDIPLVNISTRGQVQTGNNVMIGGFVIEGAGPQQVLIRARGPSMIPAGVTNALADPTMSLVNQATGVVIATNDDWGSAVNASSITATGKAPTNALESAILVTLDPGAYTVVVSGVNGGTGVGIVEVFAQ